MTEPAPARRMPTICLPGIEPYAEAHTSPEPAHLAALTAETNELLGDRSQMLVGPLQGRLMSFLVAMLQPRLVLEIGMFTGYSALSMAEALPPGGRIITCEISDRHAAIARKHIEASPYGDRIETRMGPALETVQALEGPFDFVFIDADKQNQVNYFEAVLPKLSERGVIAVDNVIWSGRVLDAADESEDTKAVRAFNAHVAADPRVEQVMLTVRDGLTLIRRRREA